MENDIFFFHYSDRGLRGIRHIPLEIIDITKFIDSNFNDLQTSISLAVLAISCENSFVWSLSPEI